MLFAGAFWPKREKNIPFEMHIFEKGRHGMSVADQTSAEAKKEVVPLL